MIVEQVIQEYKISNIKELKKLIHCVDNIFSEARVLQVERKSVLKPDQAEFVLSEGIVNNYITL